MNIFRAADILLPENIDMNAWSVVACDQFTSEPEYWEKVEEIVGDKPSTLRLMLPEAMLKNKDPELEREKIYSAMDAYQKEGLFKQLNDSYIYVERRLSSGVTRHGIVGMIDLEAYDWKENSNTPIRATEFTVEDRLPPRVKVRENASLELPHIMIFVDDPENNVLGSAEKGEKLYDFDLMQSGGHIAGWKVANNSQVEKAFCALSDKSRLVKKYGNADNPIVYAIGDGNHSIAAAKKLWESIKPNIPENERDNCPQRFVLTEIVNIHDEAISFEPIHRVIFDTDNSEFIRAAENYFGDYSGKGREVCIISGNEKVKLDICGLTIGQLIEKCDIFCREYIVCHGGYIDYIHGDSECESMSGKTGCAGILLPKMEKDELFLSVHESGQFPKKSFSIGHGPDKRYYLECRAIKPCHIE